MYEGTWAVVYDDDTVLTQKDEGHPQFHKESFEVPYKAIEWPRVRKVLFHSLDDTTEFTVLPTPDWAVSMRSRVFMNQQGKALRAFMLIISTPGNEVDAESVQRVMYWFLNGVIHDCPHFNCDSVGAYAMTWVHGTQGAGLIPIHDAATMNLDAALVTP